MVPRRWKTILPGGGGIDGVCEGLELRPLADAVEELDQMRQ